MKSCWPQDSDTTKTSRPVELVVVVVFFLELAFINKPFTIHSSGVFFMQKGSFLHLVKLLNKSEQTEFWQLNEYDIAEDWRRRRSLETKQI